LLRPPAARAAIAAAGQEEVVDRHNSIADAHAPVIAAAFAGEEVEALDVASLEVDVGSDLARRQEQPLQRGRHGARSVQRVVGNTVEERAEVFRLDRPRSPDRQVFEVELGLKRRAEAASVEVVGVQRAWRTIAQVTAGTEAVLSLVGLADAGRT